MNAKMPELKRCFEKAGFTEVRTVLSSGNVVFVARATPVATLERRIEKAMQDELDRVFYTLVKSVDDLKKILESDPFQEFRLKPAAKRVVTFMRKKVDSPVSLPISRDGASLLKLQGTELYSAYEPSPKGPVFMKMIEENFGKDVTTRTWDTVRKVTK